MAAVTPAPVLVYDDGWAQLWCGDCRDVLPILTHTFDLLITDPPYGVQWESGRRKEPLGPMEGDMDTAVSLAGLKLAVRLIRQSRHAYIFGDFDLSEVPVTKPVELIWDKGNISAGDLTCPWGKSHERVWFAVCERSAANRAKGYGAMAARLRKQTVLHYPRANSGGVRHPTEKPVGLLREFIESSSRIGEVVLDPFAGIGSTLVASKLEGRRSVGIEIDFKWCNIAIERLIATPATDTSC